MKNNTKYRIRIEIEIKVFVRESINEYDHGVVVANAFAEYKATLPTIAAATSVVKALCEEAQKQVMDELTARVEEPAPSPISAAVVLDASEPNPAPHAHQQPLDPEDIGSIF